MSVNYKILVPFILRWEGGVSNDKADSGGLTNKGITFVTYGNLSKSVLNKEPTKQNFLAMTERDAELIIRFFWNKATNNNGFNSQKISEAVTTWFWGSGSFGLKEFQRLLNKKHQAKLAVDGKIGNKTMSVVNRINEHTLFVQMVEARKQFFIDLTNRRPKDKRFLNGWLNRLNDFYIRNKRADDPKIKLVGIVGLMALAFLVIRSL